MSNPWTNPYLGEIRMIAFNEGVPPADWAFCNGQLLKIEGNEALFSLIGTMYGGDGTTNFALPDLQGRVPVHTGANYPLGRKEGEEGVTLAQDELPKHNHGVNSDAEGGNPSPEGRLWGNSSINPYIASPTGLTFNAASITNYGNGEAHENRIPFQALKYIISLTGNYPSQQ